MSHVRFARRTILAVAALVLPLAAAQAVDRTGGAFNTLYAGLGAKGYDVVAYHTLGEPTPGKAEFQQAHGGVTWQFANADHLATFKADPARYVPQFGGFCSWGVAQGKLFDVDPVNGWKIVDGKLYMNFNADIQKAWEKDIPGFVARADGNWPKLNQ
jgi:YHS domain-containing protein